MPTLQAHNIQVIFYFRKVTGAKLKEKVVLITIEISNQEKSRHLIIFNLFCHVCPTFDATQFKAIIL